MKIRPPTLTLLYEVFPIGNMTARDGDVYIDGQIIPPEHARNLARYLEIVADVAEHQREYENEQAQP